MITYTLFYISMNLTHDRHYSMTAFLVKINFPNITTYFPKSSFRKLVEINYFTKHTRNLGPVCLNLFIEISSCFNKISSFLFF